MLIRIENLRLRTEIGIEPWEIGKLQDVVVNVELRFDGTAAAASDDIADTVNYKTIAKRMIALVEGRRFNLLERLVEEALAICLDDARVEWARVKADKPHALRFADSVSVEVEGHRQVPRDQPHRQVTLGDR
jgi:D-erythro-7,8-dihydroneopterin triphosphate epimerase